MGTKINRAGLVYDKLTAIKESSDRRHNKVTWICKCECGNEKLVTAGDLQSGKVRTCGEKDCRTYNTEAAHEACRSHGMCETRMYKIWAGMKDRCKTDKYYAGKGIKVCDEWMKFEPFRDWSVDNGYSEELTIDRINSKGDYCPENCRWATRKEQARNTSRNRIIEYNGMKKCINEWAEYLDINTRTLIHRLNYGWDLERAFTTKAGKYEGN